MKSVWPILNKVQSATGLNDHDFADLLGLSNRHFKMLRTRKMSPPFSSAAALTNRLNLSLESLFDGKIDYKVLGAHFKNSLGELPERYTVGAFSRRRTVITPMTYIRNVLGECTLTTVLKQLQISEVAFEDPNEKVNVRLMIDICKYLGQLENSDTILYSAGTYTLSSPATKIIRAELGTGVSPSGIYERIIGELVAKYFDSNCFYKIESISANRCFISARPNPEVQDALHQKHLGSEGTCQFRAGVIASFSGFNGYRISRVLEKSCVHRGDSICLYEVEFPEGRQEIL